MRFRSLGAVVPLVLLCAASAAAQPAAPTPEAPLAAPPPQTPPTAQPPRALAGQPVILEVAEQLSSKTHKRGDMFAIRLAAPIAVGTEVVIPAGAMGKGQVIDAAPAGPLGRPAKLLLAARYLEIDGVQAPLRGFHLGSAGRDNTNLIMAASFVPYVGVLASFMKGGEIVIPPGALGQAKLGADFPASPTAAAPTASAAVPQASQ
jgi:hypothetical protein